MSNMKKTAIIVVSIFLAIIIAGAIVFGIAQFNYDSTVSGSVEIKVELGEYAYTDSEREDYKKDIEKIVDDEFKIVKDTRIQEESGTYAILVYSVEGNQKTADSIASEKDSSFEEKLTAYFLGKQVDFDYEYSVSAEKVGGIYSKSIVIKSIIALGVIGLAVCIYFAIRFGIASALISFLSIIVEFAVALSIVAFTRIPVGGQAVIALWALLATSLTASIIYNSYVRAEKKSVEEGTWEERCLRANAKSNKVIFKSFIAIIASIIIAVALVPVNIKITVALLALVVLVVGVNAILLKPILRLWLGKCKREKKTGYALYAKQKETKV